MNNNLKILSKKKKKNYKYEYSNKTENYVEYLFISMVFF